MDLLTYTLPQKEGKLVRLGRMNGKVLSALLPTRIAVVNTSVNEPANHIFYKVN